MCSFYGIPVIDLYTECPLNATILSIRNQFFGKNSTDNIPEHEGSHPNAEGQQLLGEFILSKLLTFIN